MNTSAAISFVGFAFAAIAFFVVAMLSLSAHGEPEQRRVFGFASLSSAVWAAVLAGSFWTGQAEPVARLIFFDALHAGAWLVFLGVSLVRGRDARAPARRAGYILLAGAVACAAVLAALLLDMPARQPAGLKTAALHGVLLALPLLGFVGLQQRYQTSRREQRRTSVSLLLGLVAIFATDAFVHAHALIAGLDSTNWLLRGLPNGAAAILLGLAVAGQRDWNREVRFSRNLVTYSAAFSVSVLYFFLLLSIVFLLGEIDLAWAGGLQTGILLVGVAVYVIAASTTSLRRRLRAYVTKHFLLDRYDYRKEWLRLIETLVGRADDMPLRQRAVKALADIIGSSRGELWLAGEADADFFGHGAWGGPVPLQSLTKDDHLVDYLRKSRWVVDTHEYAQYPERYSHAFERDEFVLQSAAIFVPIVHREEVIGIVRLERPAGLGDLSFEDHDLLKTAGQQIAVFLTGERAQEELLETRQFEAFSKLTAFLMHDLKNMLAQLDLIVSNAQRFKHRPEFVDDAVGTIGISVNRIRALLDRLQGASRTEQTSRINLRKLLEEVCKDSSDRQPAPVFRQEMDELVVRLDRERLSMAITHLIRNAQDATQADGEVSVSLSASDETAVIEVRDTGSGMEQEFIRDRLFRPFDSTKGVQGMGIGAYQIRETIVAAGGRIEVESEVGIGTTMRIELPLERSTPAAALAGSQAAAVAAQAPDRAAGALSDRKLGT